MRKTFEQATQEVLDLLNQAETDLELRRARLDPADLQEALTELGNARESLRLAWNAIND